jgi:predicted transport protein
VTDKTTESEYRRPRSWQEMREQEIRWLIERTGEGLETWNARILGQEFGDEASLRGWLTQQGVTGYPQMLLVMERFGYPDFLNATADELVDGQYADRPGLRPILDALLALLPELGDVEIQTRKTYVAFLTPRRTFGALQPTTRKRADLGLRLTADQQPEGRLERAVSFGQSSVTHKIGLTSVDDIDDEVVDWMKRAYDLSA